MRLEFFRWCNAAFIVMFGLAACTENGNSGSKAVGAQTRESLKQHVQTGLESLEWGKLKDLGFAPPYDLANKDFEKAYEVAVVGMEWKEAGGHRNLRGMVRLTGSSKDPRTDLWLTEVVHLEFVRVDGRGPWKLITYRGQVEDYFSRAVPGEAIEALPRPVQDYLKTAFEILPAKELTSTGG